MEAEELSAPTSSLEKPKDKKHKSKPTRSPRTRALIHRNNERLRHQLLNQLIENLCSKVPGNDPDYTKVYRLRRTIRYICYLENLAEQLSIELNVPLVSSFKRLSMETKPAKSSSHSCRAGPSQIRQRKARRVLATAWAKKRNVNKENQVKIPRKKHPTRQQPKLASKKPTSHNPNVQPIPACLNRDDAQCDATPTMAYIFSSSTEVASTSALQADQHCDLPSEFGCYSVEDEGFVPVANEVTI